MIMTFNSIEETDGSSAQTFDDLEQGTLFYSEDTAAYYIRMDGTNKAVDLSEGDVVLFSPSTEVRVVKTLTLVSET
jgi:hypothetical protein